MLSLKLFSTETDSLRRSIKHYKLDKVKNTTFEQKMNDKNSLMDWVRYKQLEWYGHVFRMPEAVSRQVWEWIQSGGGERKGPSRSSWIDDI